MPAHRFRIGQFNCLIVEAMRETLAISSLLADVPKEDIEQAARQQGLDPEALDFSMNILLVDTGRHRVLIDSGIVKSNVPEMFKAEGIDPATIDKVVVTHGHGDHVEGILDAMGKFVYPRARYVTGKTEFAYWTDPKQLEEGEQTPGRAGWKALKANPDKLDLIEPKDQEVVPGIRAVSTPGHTVGHIAISVESGGDQLLHIVDAAHCVVQIAHTDWSPNFDYDKTMAAQTRRKLFERAARDNALVLGYHFPFPGLGHVTSDSGTLRWKASGAQ
jgi:glyoxylase-like metal-dependent hydrolase (beta-lactamase superfamily II)